MPEPSLIFSKTVSIPVQSSEDVPFSAGSSDGFFLVDLEVSQLPGRVDDIQAYVYDAASYVQLVNNRRAVRAGASVSLLPKPTSLLYAKVYWAVLFFQPLSRGDYYLVLNNTHSSVTPKTVTVKLYWLWSNSAWLSSIKQALLKNGWENVWTLLENARLSLEQKKLIDCCSNLRLALVTLWTRVCEKLDEKAIVFEPGKSPDIGILLDCMKRKGISQEMAGLVARHWSLVSELSHVEKRGGQSPPETEVAFAHNLTFSSISYLLSLENAT